MGSAAPTAVLSSRCAMLVLRHQRHLLAPTSAQPPPTQTRGRHCFGLEPDLKQESRALGRGTGQDRPGAPTGGRPEERELTLNQFHV